MVYGLYVGGIRLIKKASRNRAFKRPEKPGQMVGKDMAVGIRYYAILNLILVLLAARTIFGEINTQDSSHKVSSPSTAISVDIFNLYQQ